METILVVSGWFLAGKTPSPDILLRPIAPLFLRANLHLLLERALPKHRPTTADRSTLQTGCANCSNVDSIIMVIKTIGAVTSQFHLQIYSGSASFVLPRVNQYSQ